MEVEIGTEDVRMGRSEDHEDRQPVRYVPDDETGNRQYLVEVVKSGREAGPAYVAPCDPGAKQRNRDIALVTEDETA